ncbi:sensor histidine kinase [Halospeciosus flavus]|uniref:histidine kinase n=1 Tax=Halospeciosus flavus TaxID=3032283 RepID=A0ABD5Z5Q7_9EURY|nr:HAMP domain-containing sensor histidine kinase [Halospeciosus flavus]
MDRWRGLGLLAGLGAGAFVLPLYDIWSDVAVPPYKSVSSTLAENALPVALAVVFLAGVVLLSRRDWDADETFRAAKWTSSVTLVGAVLMAWVLGIQLVVQGDVKPFVVAGNAVVIAAVSGLAIGISDVERRRRYATLQTQRNHFSALYENTTDAIVTFGPTTEGVDVTNTNRTFDALTDDPPRQVLDRLEPTSDAEIDVDVETDELNATDGEFSPVEYVRAGARLDVEAQTTVDGAQRFFKLRVVPTDNRHTYVVLTDIGEQKERERLIEERGERLEREKSQRERELEERTDQLEFLHSLLRHDVQNGVMVIRSRANFVADRTDGQLEEFAETIVSRSTDIGDQIDRMRVALETLTSEEWETQPISISLLTERVESVAGANPEADLAVEGRLPDVSVRADEMFGDVLDNLLRNAVEHNASETPTVRVRAAVEDDYVRIEVADDGPGIPEDQRDAVFRRGVTSASASGDSGSGFGLFFADSMVDAYGGSIRVEDSDLGGACFVLELNRPASDDATESP